MLNFTNKNFTSINVELAAQVSYLHNDYFKAQREGHIALTETEKETNLNIFKDIATGIWDNYKNTTDANEKAELLAHIANYFVVSEVETHRDEEKNDAVVVYRMRNKANLEQIIESFKEAEDTNIKIIERVEGNVYYTLSGIINLDKNTLTALVPLETLEYTLEIAYKTYDIAEELVKETPEVIEYINQNWTI